MLLTLFSSSNNVLLNFISKLVEDEDKLLTILDQFVVDVVEEDKFVFVFVLVLSALFGLFNESRN